MSERCPFFDGLAGHTACMNAFLWSLCLSASLLLSAAFAWQDWKTRYFQKWWLAAGLLLVICGCVLYPISLMVRMGGALFGLLLIPLVMTDRLGSADVWFIAGMGWILGAYNLPLALSVSCTLGLLYGFLVKEALIPFISFLSVGYVMALLFICLGESFIICV